MAELYLVECERCGDLVFSTRKRMAKQEAYQHKEDTEDHTIQLHIFESKESTIL